MKPLLVFAMEQESQDVFPDYDVLHCGIGKVNAAHALTRRLVTAKPSIVINMGTAGSRKHKGGAVINCTAFIQRDMDVTSLGFEKFKTPFSPDPITIQHGVTVDGFTQGICGTGDNFDATEAAGQFDAVDMEAYALALICQREKIPFLCLKYVSDGADDNAQVDFMEALHHAAVRLRDALKKSGH